MNKELEKYSIEELVEALEEKNRIAEEEKEKPIREAFLKEDWHLIEFDSGSPHLFIINRNEYLCPSSKIIDLLITERILQKGSRFVEYADDGWFDDVGRFEFMSNGWAKEHLENFNNLKKDKEEENDS